MIIINRHEMELQVKAFDGEDLLIVIILIVICTCELYNFPAQFLIIHLEFDKNYSYCGERIDINFKK